MTADVRSLAVGRIVLASVLLLDLFKRWTQLGLFYTNDGLIPNHTLLWRPGFAHVFSLFYLASYRHEAIIGFVLCALSYGALLIGFRTRIAQILSLIALLSLHGRLLLFDNGGDVVLGLLCTWTTFLPTGRRLSVDAVLARRRLQLAPDASPLAAREPFAVPDPKRQFASLAVGAVIFQLAFIYLFNAVHKGGLTWRDGSAVHYTLHLDRLATWFAVWLRDRLPPGPARALTYSTLAIEWSLPFLLLSPFRTRVCRRLAVLLVIVLHAGFACCLNLGIFVPAMMAFTPNLVPGEDWDALARWWRSGPERRRFSARLHDRVTSIIERAAALFSPGVTRQVLEPGRCARALIRNAAVGRESLVVVYLIIAGNQLLDENRAAHAIFDHHNSPTMAAAVTYMDLFQGWSMFAPDAPTTDFNIVVDAVTLDGRHVNPFNEAVNPRYPAPGRRVPPSMGPSWLVYGYENHLPNRPEYFHALEEWILRYPERTGRAADRLASFEVSVVEDDSPPLTEKAPRNVRSRLLFKYP